MEKQNDEISKSLFSLSLYSTTTKPSSIQIGTVKVSRRLIELISNSFRSVAKIYLRYTYLHILCWEGLYLS